MVFIKNSVKMENIAVRVKTLEEWKAVLEKTGNPWNIKDEYFTTYGDAHIGVRGPSRGKWGDKSGFSDHRILRFEEFIDIENQLIIYN